MKDNAESKVITRYMQLIQEFLQLRIDVAEFERRYLADFKNESVRLSDAAFDALDDLFGSVDAFCADPSLRGVGDLDEDELREKCKNALAKLLAIRTG